MRKINLFIACTVAIISVISSCNKETDETTKAQMLTGTWKTVRAADDDNNNGIWDASENTDIGDDTLYYALNANGSGLITGEVPAPIPINWNLQNGDTELRVIIPGKADTSVAHILTLTSTDLITKNDTTKTIAFIAYKKL